MQVQRIQGNNFNTSFKSKVYITNYDTQESNIGHCKELFNSKRFLNSIKHLEKNGNNDIVVFGVDELGYVNMTVKDGDKISQEKIYINNPYDSEAIDCRNYKFIGVSEAYQKCKTSALENSWDAEIPTHLDKYVIS